jgi:hypothetical protein
MTTKKRKRRKRGKNRARIPLLKNEGLGFTWGFEQGFEKRFLLACTTNQLNRED